jgi:hypothetical protein
MSVIDIYGIRWNVDDDETCEDCGQPDNCGDCTHEQLSPEDVESLGGISLDKQAQLRYRYPIKS